MTSTLEASLVSTDLSYLCFNFYLCLCVTPSPSVLPACICLLSMRLSVHSESRWEIQDGGQANLGADRV